MGYEFGIKNYPNWKVKLLIATILESLLVILCFGYSYSWKIAFVCFLAYIVCANVRVNVKRRNQILFYAVITLSLGYICLNLSQLIMNENISKISLGSILLGVMLYCIVVIIFYFLFMNYVIANSLALIMILGITTVNYYVFQFRGCELTANDFLSIRTAMNVVGEYKISLTGPIVYSWSFVFIIIYALIFSIKFEKAECKKWIRRLRSGILAFGMLVMFSFMTNGMTVLSYDKCGTIYNGFCLNLALSLKQGHVKKPSNYSETEIFKLEKGISTEIIKDENVVDYPNVIVVMNESFADLSVLGELYENEDVLSYYDSLNNNIIKGYAISSVYGGGTPNSEYEFLSGNTMGYLPTGSIAYQQYIKKPTYSLVEIFKSLNYQCISMHPYSESGWMRTTVYPLLGFDNSYFIQDFPQKKLVREYVSDQEMYEQIIEKYENKPDDQPLFLFGVTMQNHGGYEYEGNDFEYTNFLSGMSREYSDVEQYLALLQISDEALKTLIEYFKAIEDKTIVVFYGDHQPNLDNNFLEEVHGGNFDTLDEQELMYKVPFFIWANYDIEEENVELTSLNFLSNYLFKAAGIGLPAYNQFLLNIQKVIPAMNSQGYYSKNNGRFQLYSDAEGQEAEALNQYRILQYNAIFDEKNRSDVFFPME